MIRQSAFEKTGNKMLKGGLHCHTTRSDGKTEPGETIRQHVRMGYDFLAITDHRKYNYENFAPETEGEILIIPGMEMDRSMPAPGELCRHCFHTVCIGPRENNGFAQDQEFERGEVADQFEYQPILDMIHANNNLTVLCHPQWSSTPPREFEQLKGNFAMEIWNSSCAIACEIDNDAKYWDELLYYGHRIFGVAADDGHRAEMHGRGWVCVNAEKDVDSILAALKNGAFYSSCGPEIYDFYIEDGVARIECSPVERIRFHYFARPIHVIRGENGAPVTSGSQPVPDYFNYIRASVVDSNGHIAWTNPIFGGAAACESLPGGAAACELLPR